jgi:hypothetical protein
MKLLLLLPPQPAAAAPACCCRPSLLLINSRQSQYCGSIEILNVYGKTQL